MSSELPSNDIIETLALNANAILAADEVVVKREHLKNCLAALDDTTRAKINPGDPTAYGHIQQALAREVKA